MINKNKRAFRVKTRLLEGAAFLFLAAFSYLMLFPAAPSNAMDATAEIAIDVDSTLEMALSATSVALTAADETEILPDSAGILATGDVTVYVTSNNANNYTLSIYSADNSNSMTHINTNVTAAIAPTSGNESATLAADTWGFKYSNASGWVAVGVDEENPAMITSGTRTNTICNDMSNPKACPIGSVNAHLVTFGANVTDSLPSGQYTSNVVFSVTVAPGEQGGGEN